MLANEHVMCDLALGYVQGFTWTFRAYLYRIVLDSHRLEHLYDATHLLISAFAGLVEQLCCEVYMGTWVS